MSIFWRDLATTHYDGATVDLLAKAEVAQPAICLGKLRSGGRGKIRERRDFPEHVGEFTTFLNPSQEFTWGKY